MFEQRLCPDSSEILGWLCLLSGQVKVIYEAGPTGFGLCRALIQPGVEYYMVIAPSKLQWPARARLRTNARDPLHLARLLRLDEIVEVTVPSMEQETRDLVRVN
jgi:transposase